jgi:hypothetical protein
MIVQIIVFVTIIVGCSLFVWCETKMIYYKQRQSKKAVQDKTKQQAKYNDLPSGAELGQQAQIVIAQVGRHLTARAGNVQQGTGDLRQARRRLG